MEGNNLKVLAIYRHYWPDKTPYAGQLRLILERLVEEGHDVTAYSGQPSYGVRSGDSAPTREQLGGVDVIRVSSLPGEKRWLPVRAANILWHLLRAIFHATFCKKYDIVIANSQPPVLIGLALRCLTRLTGCKSIFHVQDIHPEVLAVTGGKKLFFQTLRQLDTSSCKRVTRIVTLSSDMKVSLTNRSPELASISVINNCPPRVFSTEATTEIQPLNPLEKTSFLFAGNLGRFQALQSVATATKLTTRSNQMVVTFMGSGLALESTRAAANPNVAKFIPRQSLQFAVAAMKSADYGIVSLSSEVVRYAYPSKTLAYLAAGLPLLLIVDTDSELADMVTRERLGVVSASHSPAAIAIAFDSAVAQRSEWTASRRQEIALFAQRQFGETKMLNAWADTVSSIGSKQATPCRLRCQSGAAA